MDENGISNKTIITNFSSIKEMLKFVKDNTAIFLLIPTLIGGIIQLYNLYIINPYLIRFFSLTQLVSDGLWILLIFLPLYFLVPLALVFLSPTKHAMFKGNDKDKKGIVFFNFMFLTSYLVFGYFVVTKEIYWLLWMSIATSLMGIAQNNQALKVFKEQQIYRNWIEFYYMALALTTMAFVYTLTLNKSMPKNIANLQIVEENIQRSFPNYKHKLLYINDKYLFSKVYCDSINELNTKIMILKVDDLFAWETNK